MKNPSLSLEPSEELDQNKLEILSETVSLRMDNRKEDKWVEWDGVKEKEKKKEGFGEFELE